MYMKTRFYCLMIIFCISAYFSRECQFLSPSLSLFLSLSLSLSLPPPPPPPLPLSLQVAERDPSLSPAALQGGSSAAGEGERGRRGSGSSAGSHLWLEGDYLSLRSVGTVGGFVLHIWLCCRASLCARSPVQGFTSYLLACEDEKRSPAYFWTVLERSLPQQVKPEIKGMRMCRDMKVHVVPQSCIYMYIHAVSQPSDYVVHVHAVSQPSDHVVHVHAVSQPSDYVHVYMNMQFHDQVIM